MKKMILLLAILLVGLTFTSCIKDGKEQISGKDFAYITKSPLGVNVARIFNWDMGYLTITSNEIQNDMESGECYFLSYNWTSEMGTLNEEDLSFLQAQLIGDPVSIDQSTLQTVVELPTLTDTIYFSMRPSVYDVSDYFNDNWLIEYTFEAREGEITSLDFYLAQPQPIEDEYVIDVVMTKTGTATGKLEKKTKFIAANLKEIRNLYPSTGTKLKDIFIKFRFYNSDLNDLFTTPSYTMRVFHN